MYFQNDYKMRLLHRHIEHASKLIREQHSGFLAVHDLHDCLMKVLITEIAQKKTWP